MKSAFHRTYTANISTVLLAATETGHNNEDHSISAGSSGGA